VCYVGVVSGDTATSDGCHSAAAAASDAADAARSHGITSCRLSASLSTYVLKEMGKNPTFWVHARLWFFDDKGSVLFGF